MTKEQCGVLLNLGRSAASPALHNRRTNVTVRWAKSSTWKLNWPHPTPCKSEFGETAPGSSPHLRWWFASPLPFSRKGEWKGKNVHFSMPHGVKKKLPPGPPASSPWPCLLPMIWFVVIVTASWTGNPNSAALATIQKIFQVHHREAALKPLCKHRCRHAWCYLG